MGWIGVDGGWGWGFPLGFPLKPSKEKEPHANGIWKSSRQQGWFLQGRQKVKQFGGRLLGETPIFYSSPASVRTRTFILNEQSNITQKHSFVGIGLRQRLLYLPQVTQRLGSRLCSRTLPARLEGTFPCISPCSSLAKISTLSIPNVYPRFHPSLRARLQQRALACDDHLRKGPNMNQASEGSTT